MTILDRKFYVLDTNVLLQDPLSILAFVGHNAVIPSVALEELDNIKGRKDRDVSREAMMAIRNIEKVIGDAEPDVIRTGVPIPDCLVPNHEGTLAIFSDDAAANKALQQSQESQESQESLRPPTPDNLIIGTALHYQGIHKNAKVVLVTKDINMRLKAKAYGLKHVEDYRNDQVAENIESLSKGYVEDVGFLDRLSEGVTVQMSDGKSHSVAASDLPISHPKSFIVDRHRDYVGYVKDVADDQRIVENLSLDSLMNQSAWAIRPRNLEQALAMKLLTDTDVDMVVISGPAGSGKTLLALACAIDAVCEKKLFDRIILTKTTDTIGDPIGFLPGTEEEKMKPVLGGFIDALEYLHEADDCPSSSVDYVMQKANIQFRSIAHMRGRSFQKTFIIIDESQNLNPSQMKSLVTRVGEGSKLIVLGNLAQIDNKFITPLTSGLAHLIERSKDFEHSGAVYVNGVLRSRLAAFGEKSL